MIDKKGRIFGKINVIDFIVALIIVCLLAGIGYKLFGQSNNSTEEGKVETGTVYATFQMTYIMKESKNFVEVGDKLIINGEVTDIEVVDIVFEDTKYVDITDDGELVIADNPLYVDGRIQVKAEGTKTSEGIKIGENIIRVNSNFDISTERFSAGSKIVDVQFEPQQ